MQVTIIGGGSYQWSPKLIADLLGTGVAGRHAPRARGHRPRPAGEDGGAAPGQLDDELGAKATVSTTTDQRAALDGADFVIVTISTGGFESMAVDLDVPARHGIRQSVGDTRGPGGISRSLRNIPVLVGIGRRHGGGVPRRLAAQHHQPDDLPDPLGVPARRRSRPSACATRSATSAWTWPSPSASPTPPCDPRGRGQPLPRHHRASTSTARDGFAMLAEHGGRARRARGAGARDRAGPRPSRSRRLDFARRARCSS